MREPNSGSWKQKDISHHFGQEYNFLTIRERAQGKKGGCIMVVCDCKANGVGCVGRCEAALYRVLKGRTISCGCVKRSRSKRRYEEKAIDSLTPAAIRSIWLSLTDGCEANSLAKSIGTSESVVIAAKSLHSDYLKREFDSYAFIFANGKRTASRLASQFGLDPAEALYLIKHFQYEIHPSERVKLASQPLSLPNSINTESLQSTILPIQKLSPSLSSTQERKQRAIIPGHGQVLRWNSIPMTWNSRICRLLLMGRPNAQA